MSESEQVARDFVKEALAGMPNGQAPAFEEMPEWCRESLRETYRLWIETEDVQQVRSLFDTLAGVQPELWRLKAEDETPATTLDVWRAQLRTVNDAYTERESLTYIVDGLIEQGSLNIVYGAPGCLKTMLLIDMAVCVASGQPWLESLQDEA